MPLLIMTGPSPSIADYDRAIALNLSLGLVFNNRGNVYYNLGEYEKAIADYTIVIEMNPNDTNSYYSRWSAYDNQNEFDLAAADYRKALELGGLSDQFRQHVEQRL